MTRDVRDDRAGRATVHPRTGTVRRLVGSGDKVALFTLPFAIAGLTANILDPSFFSVGGPPRPYGWSPWRS